MEANDDALVYMERAQRVYELMERLCLENNITMDFVLRTGFVSWLNDDPERVLQYTTGEAVEQLVEQYLQWTVVEDAFVDADDDNEEGVEE